MENVWCDAKINNNFNTNAMRGQKIHFPIRQPMLAWKETDMSPLHPKEDDRPKDLY